MALAALLLAVLYYAGRFFETRREVPEPRGDHHARLAYEETVTFDGNVYRRKAGQTTILLLGVDQSNEGRSEDGTRNGGQADFLRLVVLDSVEKTITQVQIDRDTITPIPVLGVLGNRAGTRTAQICLAHGFGGGGERGCELVAEAVSELFYGVAIDFYIAMDPEGIALLNDAVGGVTVTLDDDFSSQDAAMKKGATLTLRGRQAEIFTRSRMNAGDGTNKERMARQQVYLAAFAERLTERMREDDNFTGALFDEMLPRLDTNLSRGRLINEAWAALSYERSGTVAIAGTGGVGEAGFMEFYPDQEDLLEMVLELFYQRTEQ